jgi:hypothetical protein
MHLQLGPEELRRLLAMAYLGEAVLNDWTPDPQQTAEQQRATDLLYELCTLAANSPNADLVTVDPDTKRTVPSASFQESMARLLENYDDRVFWDELVERLAHRDLTKEYGIVAMAQMSDPYRQAVERPLIDHYRTETERHGVANLHIQESKPEPTATKEMHPRQGDSTIRSAMSDGKQDSAQS